MNEATSTPKSEMLDYLDEIRRRVVCEDVVGFTLVAITKTDQVLNRRGGDTSDPFFILVETELATRHRAEFMQDNLVFDQHRRPRLDTTEEAEDGSNDLVPPKVKS